MRITSKGQVTIPAEIRQKAGLLPDTEVDFRYDGNVVTVFPARGKGKGRGRRLVEHLRRNPGDIRMSTDEILALTRGEP